MPVQSSLLGKYKTKHDTTKHYNAQQDMTSQQRCLCWQSKVVGTVIPVGITHNNTRQNSTPQYISTEIPVLTTTLIGLHRCIGTYDNRTTQNITKHNRTVHHSTTQHSTMHRPKLMSKQKRREKNG